MKTKFHGKFNWHGEVHELWRYATKSSAYSVLTRALGKEIGIIPWAIRGYFNGSKDNFEIKEVKE